MRVCMVVGLIIGGALVWHSLGNRVVRLIGRRIRTRIVIMIVVVLVE